MNSLVKDYLDSRFQNEKPGNYVIARHRNNGIYFRRVDGETVILLKQSIGKLDLVEDTSISPEQTRKILYDLALDWLHERALREMEKEKSNQHDDFMRLQLVDFSLRRDVEEIEGMYDDRA